MANYLNIFAGILTFLGSSVIAYGLWNPVMNFLNAFPTELFVICGAMWVTLLFYAITYMPFIMMVSDDRGA